jgi:hypothetical protein
VVVRISEKEITIFMKEMQKEKHERSKQPEKPKKNSHVDPHKKYPAMSFVEFIDNRFMKKV